MRFGISTFSYPFDLNYCYLLPLFLHLNPLPLIHDLLTTPPPILLNPLPVLLNYPLPILLTSSNPPIILLDYSAGRCCRT